MSDERHDAVSRRAYELWEREGGGHGRHDEHWHRAAREVDEESVNVTAPDGTMMPIATAAEVMGVDQIGGEQPPPAKAPRQRAAKPSQAAPSPTTKTTAKPRKPKAK